jgi:hypothetical protein
MSAVRIVLVLGSALAAVCAGACSGRIHTAAGAEGGNSEAVRTSDSGANEAKPSATSLDAGAVNVGDGVAGLSGTSEGGITLDGGTIGVSQLPPECPSIKSVTVLPTDLHPPETAALKANVSLATDAGGTETVVWSASCDSGTPVLGNPASLETTFSCGTSVYSTCTVTLTVGLDATDTDGSTVGPLCAGVAGTTASFTLHCLEPPCCPGCPAGQIQCGSSTSDCEDLQAGNGPLGLCGTSCATAVACSGYCHDGSCLAPSDASD